jgi:hypothetical protein
MTEAEKDLYNRIGKLEDGVGDLKVDLAQTYKDLIGHHKMDEANSKYYKEKFETIETATKDKDADKSKLGKLTAQVLTPQTIVIIITVIAAVLGVKVGG